MTTLPKIETYGNYSSSNYGAHALRVDVGRLSLFFSYKTVIAFRSGIDPAVVSENSWGPTTGKHLNAIDGGGTAKKNRLPRAAFEARLTETLTALGLSL